MAGPSSELTVTPSTNPYLNAIEWGGWRWDDNPADGADKNGTVISYYFDSQPLDLNNILGDDIFGVSSRPWTVEEQAAYRVALDTWAAVANINFVEVFNYDEANLVEHVFADPEQVVARFNSTTASPLQPPYRARVMTP